VVIAEICWETSQHNKRESFISFMIHSYKEKLMANESMYAKLENASEIAVSGNFSLN
jgi:hypothetical protein